VLCLFDFGEEELHETLVDGGGGDAALYYLLPHSNFYKPGKG
jgi:hypothetical protein